MQSQTAKMIYPQLHVAAMIAARLTKSQGVVHEVHKVAAGYQVVSVNKYPPYMPPKMPLPATKPDPLAQVKKGKTWAGIEFVMLDMKFRGESKVYVDAWTEQGKQISFGKTTLIAWEVQGDRVLLKMPKSTAKKRGLMAI